MKGVGKKDGGDKERTNWRIKDLEIKELTKKVFRFLRSAKTG